MVHVNQGAIMVNLVAHPTCKQVTSLVSHGITRVNPLITGSRTYSVG